MHGIWHYHRLIHFLLRIIDGSHTSVDLGTKGTVTAM